jgi:hypothetical protein
MGQLDSTCTGSLPMVTAPARMVTAANSASCGPASVCAVDTEG